jgi:hypothetical protein
MTLTTVVTVATESAAQLTCAKLWCHDFPEATYEPNLHEKSFAIQVSTDNADAAREYLDELTLMGW